MYEDLIKSLKDAMRFAESRGYSGMANVIKQAADAIEERCQQVDKFMDEAARLYAKLPRWISVEERLPLRGDAVLCVGDNGMSIADFVCGDKWCVLPWFYVDGEQETNVTHWMPLPSAPTEET